jgi:hypothetical protein
MGYIFEGQLLVRYFPKVLSPLSTVTNKISSLTINPNMIQTRCMRTRTQIGPHVLKRDALLVARSYA